MFLLRLSVPKKAKGSRTRKLLVNPMADGCKAADVISVSATRRRRLPIFSAKIDDE